MRERIELPDPGRFPSQKAYYRVAIHEVGHWTGHPARMNRRTLEREIEQRLGSPDYAREEQRAELQSYLTGARMALGHDSERHRRFAAEWGEALRQGPREFYKAAWSAAQISRYVTVRVPEMARARSGARFPQGLRASVAEAEQWGAFEGSRMRPTSRTRCAGTRRLGGDSAALDDAAASLPHVAGELGAGGPPDCT